MADRMTHKGPGQLVVEGRTKPRLKRPRMYRVLLHNDDFTPREFVVMVLQSIFRMEETQATQLMLQVHTEGAGTVGIFTHQIAETKVAQVIATANRANFPLMCSMEPAEDEGDSAP